ncbi:SRPBCC domain-containing protein [Cryptosporangium sp. NPDC051539]|uniref:SRPBCC domain-containing protein n=1 Tax=Cryptosporangium sp. NPDC051539 TaxID=3363962 RepID=UPI00378D755F
MTTGPLGEARTDDDGTGTLVFHRTFPDPIEDVWATLTDSDRLARWYGHYEGTGGTGGTVELTITGEVDAGGKEGDPVTVSILECVPPHRLVVEMAPEGEGTWHLAATLSEHAGGTTLLFEQRLPAGFPYPASEVEPGWRWYLDRLVAAVAGDPMPPWKSYAP